ncbi:hypothetical protein M3Y97_01001000 [Aphelenchoides bicaudatus]|nr:hypothetical protein M3Y97_01001000 [Aphelenchoides bicaudatus]
MFVVFHFVLILLAMQRSSVDAQRLADVFRLFADESETQATEAQCEAVFGAKNAQFFEQHVYIPQQLSLESAEDTLNDDGQRSGRRFAYDIADHRSRLDRISRTLRSSIYAPKMCNPETFYPTVFDGSESPMSCKQICTSCVPGSAAVCHQRNHRFPGIGQTCFCTYDYNSPLHNAVLVVKNARSSSASRHY